MLGFPFTSDEPLMLLASRIFTNSVLNVARGIREGAQPGVTAAGFPRPSLSSLPECQTLGPMAGDMSLPLVGEHRPPVLGRVPALTPLHACSGLCAPTSRSTQDLPQGLATSPFCSL